MTKSFKESLGIGLVVGGLGMYLFPEFTGVLSGPPKTSTEHRELIGTISFIGGLLLYFMPTEKN